MNQIENHMKTHDDDIDDGSFLCSVCPYQTISREQLLKHISASHAKHICNTCNITCNSKTELKTHIVNSHKSHKPCRNYARGLCEHENEECQFKHLILQRGEYICYKCGKIFKTQTDLMNHIKIAHGNEACLKLQSGECQHGNRCIFTHVKLSARNVARPQEQVETEEAGALTQEDFPELPTAALSRLSVGDQNQNQTLESQVKRALASLMPQLTNQLVAALRK